MIICEIGQNWCGDLQLATKLITEARNNLADLVKFQLYDSKKLYGEYQNTELTFPDAKYLFNYGKDYGIEVFFSVFDVERVKWCEEIGVKKYKIATEYKSHKVIEAIAKTKKPVIISFTPEQNFWKIEYKKKLRYAKTLYCIPHYPAELNELYFLPIWFSDSQENYPPHIFDGFSDHTVGLDASKIALARGATIIEKHFAIDHHTGVDAEWSMTPCELRDLKQFELSCREALCTDWTRF